jgi:hypothetical protein
MIEQTYRCSRSGDQLRPFAEAASVKCRGYSGPLQRAITDFGADHSFGEVAKKLKEHYQIEVPISASRLITQRHAKAMLERQEITSDSSNQGARQLIAEMDGTNLPVVIIPEKSQKNPVKDRRKLRQVGWREARLSMARRAESVTATYRATMGGVDEAGKQLQDCFVKAGGGTSSRLHCVGDAASWIINQVERRFGEQASYLIDFFHVSEYLSEAAEEIAGEKKREWLKAQQEKMKQNRATEVMRSLMEATGSHKKEAGNSAVRVCQRYLSNHEQYFDYKGALEKGLPIGSGEIEGGHRWVIQKRLKLSGAWWKEENAEKMLVLRVVRANDEWQSYWDDVRQAAA